MTLLIAIYPKAGCGDDSVASWWASLHNGISASDRSGHDGVIGASVTKDQTLFTVALGSTRQGQHCCVTAPSLPVPKAVPGTAHPLDSVGLS